MVSFFTLVNVGAAQEVPGITGIALSGRILERWPGVHVVCATDWARADEMTDALD